MMSSNAAIEAKFAAAQAHWQRGEVAPSVAILRELAATRPAREDIMTLLANVLRSQGWLDTASRVMFALSDAHDFAADVSLRAARFVQQCQQHAIAARICATAIARGPVPADLLAVAGNIARELGEFDAARAYYLDALRANVDLNRWYVPSALAHAQRYADANHADFGLLRNEFGNAELSPRARAATGFGLAKAYDDVGEYAAAAAVLRIANRLVRAAVPWSGEHWTRFVDARRDERIARLPAAPRSDFRPIFVVGIPRSGTTLAATRLARCTSARDRGESRMLRHVATRLTEGDHLGDVAAIAEAADVYAAHARQDDAPAICYIDQDPLNFCHLNLIEAMFPHARIIHCRRRRRDVALSLWSHDFAHEDCAFAYDFDGIARYASGHDRLMEHWRSRLSLELYELDYETFVADPRTSLAALSAFVDAPLAATDDSVAGIAPIVSSSVWQARQPVYTRSMDRWRNYAAHIPELTDLFPHTDE